MPIVLMFIFAILDHIVRVRESDRESERERRQYWDNQNTWGKDEIC